MSFADFQERLSRSIKVVGLPDGYSQEDILENLKNAGTIEETKLGPNEMIVIFASSNEKDLSKMYDGCPIGDYVLKLEDPTSFNFGGDDTSAPLQNEEKQPEPQAPAPSTHYEPQTEYKAPVQHYEEPVHKPEPQKVEEPVHHHEPVVVHHEEPVHKPEPVVEQPKPVVEHHEPVVHKPEPVVHHEEPAHKPEPIVHHVEPVHEAPKHQEPEPVPVTHHHTQEKVEPAPVERKVEAQPERKVEAQPERKPEVVHTEKKVETAPAPVVERERKTEVSHPVKGGENSKDLLRELQNINLPARAGLPNDDVFNLVTKRSYLLIFTMIWGLQLFLRSVF